MDVARLFCKAPPGPGITVWRSFVQEGNTCKSWPCIGKFSVTINVPIVVSTAFQQYIQGRTCSPRNVKVSQWNSDYLFSKHMEFDSGFNMMTRNVALRVRPETISGFTVTVRWVLSCWWKRPVWFSSKDFMHFSSFWVVPYQGGCCQNLISSKKFNFFLSRRWKSPILGVITVFASSLFAWVWDASIFSNSSMSANIMSPFQILLAYKTYPRSTPGRTFSRDRSVAEIGWYSISEPNGIIGSLIGSPNRLS